MIKHIYALLRDDGTPFYVGASCDVARRLREHKKRFGYLPPWKLLEAAAVADWPEAESRWIEKMRTDGIELRNRTIAKPNGRQGHSEATRAILSEQGRGWPKPEGFGERLSAATKGRPKRWSPEGEDRLRVNHFKPGHDGWDRLDPERKAEIAAIRSAGAKALGPEERGRRNQVAWANATPEQRAARGRAIAEGQRRARERKATQ